MERIFITGVGTVTCVGTTRESFWDALTAGRCGLAQLQVHETTDLPVTIGGEIRTIDVDRIDHGDRVVARKMDRASQFAVWAAHDALEDAGLLSRQLGPRCAVIVGAGLSGLATLQVQTEKLLGRGPRRVSPFTIPMLMPNASPANVALAFGVTGSCYTVSSACSASGHAMIDAFETLRRGDRDFVVTGGTESSMTRLGIAAFVNMGAMCSRYNSQPERSVRPFDADRAGLIMSEGAGMVILERESHMRARGAIPYAEVLGYGSTTDAHHIVQPDPSGTGASNAIRAAIEMANLDPRTDADATYVNAHGTATAFNDAMETRALRDVFGEAAGGLQVSSTKSMTGHMIGAASGVEMIASALALRHQRVPPTINYETPDPECDLDYVPNTSRSATIRYALNNSFGFGGHNVCLVLGSTDQGG